MYICRALAVVGSPSTLRGSTGIWRTWLSWVDHFQAAVGDSVLPACPFEPAYQGGSQATASTMPRKQESRQEGSRTSRSQPAAGFSSSSRPSLPLDSRLNQQEQPATPRARPQATPSSSQSGNGSTHAPKPQAIKHSNEAGTPSQLGQSNGHAHSSPVEPSAPQRSQTSDAAKSKRKQQQSPQSEALPSATFLPKPTLKRTSKQRLI